MKQNPFYKRARKFLIVGAVVLVSIANVWTGGPEWLYMLAPTVGAALVYAVGNAPKYSDPRKRDQEFN